MSSAALKLEKTKSFDQLCNIATNWIDEIWKSGEVENSNYNYAFILDNGERIPISAGCYGGTQLEKMEKHYSNGMRAIFADTSSQRYYNKYKKSPISYPSAIRILENGSRKEFTNWVINESIFAQAFITKDADYAIKDGVLMTCDVPGNLVISACMVLRNLISYPDIPEAWTKFKEYVDPHVALMATNCLFSDGKEGNYIQRIGSHGWFQTDAYRTMMKCLLNNDLKLDKLPLWRNSLRYSPLSAIYGCNSAGGQLSRSTYPFPNGKTIQTKNSFGKVVKETPGSYTEDMLENTLKEYVKMHMAL